MSTAPRLEIATTDSAEGRVLALRGEIDAETAALLAREVRAALDDHHRRVTIDLAGVTFVDSSGISALIRAQWTASAHGAPLSIRNATGAVRRTIELRGLTQFLD